MTSTPSIRTRRVDFEGTVQLTPAGEGPRTEQYTDLSTGGLFVKSLLPETPGTKVSVDLQLMGLRLRAPGRVVWSSHDGMGVAFDSLSPAQKKLIYKKVGECLEGGQSLKVGTPPGKLSRERPQTVSESGLSRLIGRLRGR